MPTPIVFAFCKPLSSLQYSAEWSLRRLIKDWCKQTSHQIGEPSESFNVCFVCAERRFQFSRQEIFLFYLCWRKINVVLFNVVYCYLNWSFMKMVPWCTHFMIDNTLYPNILYFLSERTSWSTGSAPPPPPPSLKGAETVAVYPSLLRIFDLHPFYHSLKSADLKPHQNQYTFLSHFWSHL